MPFSTACHTPLSNFEVAQNYKEVTDPASKIFQILLSVPTLINLDKHICDFNSKLVLIGPTFVTR